MTPTAFDRRVHTAVVRAADGVRFIATAGDDDGVSSQLIDYIVSRCDDVLWPAPACEVRRLIAEHRHSEAIAMYFSNVGRRWDEEWLDTRIGNAIEPAAP
jgi:hypothetical protein